MLRNRYLIHYLLVKTHPASQRLKSACSRRNCHNTNRRDQAGCPCGQNQAPVSLPNQYPRTAPACRSQDFASPSTSVEKPVSSDVISTGIICLCSHEIFGTTTVLPICQALSIASQTSKLVRQRHIHHHRRGILKFRRRNQFSTRPAAFFRPLLSRYLQQSLSQV